MNERTNAARLTMDQLLDHRQKTGALSQETKRSELASARCMARAWAETIPECHRTNQAAMFARRALETFAAEKTRGIKLESPIVEVCGELDETAHQLAQSMGRMAAVLPMFEGCHLLTGLYAILLPRSSRSALGAFYTPPALAQRLLDIATEGGVDWRTARVLDPSSGGGAFLLEAAARMRASMEGESPSFILKRLGARLTGLELDPHAASLSQTALEIALSDLSICSHQKVPVFVKVCDTLEEEPEPVYDLVVGNPPYGRVQLTEVQRARYSRSLYGHANLYGVFTDIALRWTRPGGRIAYLTPTSVLGGQYYASLRKLLADEAPPIAIDFVHARKGVFEDVLQETLLALYERGGKSNRFQVHYLHIDGESEARVTKNGKVGLPNDATAPWLAPRQPSHVQLIAASEKLPSRLADWGYKVSTGPLVWNRFKSQLQASSGLGFRPLIWAEAITADGRFLFRAEKRNHAAYFKPEEGDEWLIVTQGCVLVQRTTAKEQPRRLIAAELPDAFVRKHRGVVVENHLNMVRAIGSPQVSIAAVAAVLNSNVVDQVFRCISGSVAVSAFELEAIPLPSPKAMVAIESLIKRKATQTMIESALRDLYGLRKS
jgi:adenine-specific DNA-methyltransferase